MDAGAIEAFEVRVADADIDDLRERLSRTRWPDQLGDAGWDYGTERSYLQELCEHWRTEFDVRKFEERCNSFPQFLTSVDGQQIHFLHVRSPEPEARPLLLTHGWPGSVAEFWDVIGPLSDPAAHGGDPAHAFHVVVPSLPGYGFSGPTSERGWDCERIAGAFAVLMGRLGYDRFFAQGGDWGSLITLWLGASVPNRVAAVHVNLLAVRPPGESDAMTGLTDAELAGLAAGQHFITNEAGYQAIQSTKPQTLAYALTDSPAGLAGWIVEKFRTWSDCDGDVERSIPRDRLLDNISIYWFTGTINSSMRLYYESMGPGRYTPPPRVNIPVGYAAFPGEIYRVPRRWAEAAHNIVHWTEMPRGGHFAALEQPDLFVSDVRDFFARQHL